MENKHICILLVAGAMAVGYVVGVKNSFGGTEGMLLGFGISVLILALIFGIAKIDD